MPHVLSPNKHILSNDRPTIAVLVGSLNSYYQEGILRGAADAAEELNINVLGFSGGAINSPDPFTQSRETIFELIDLNIIDGVIVPFGSHTRYLNSEESSHFIKRFSSVPIVNVGGVIEGLSNVVPDYEAGMIQLMDHYINVHGYRKIALFRGPVNHSSSETRMKFYKEQLISHGLKVDENLIIYGDLNKKSAVLAIEELLDTRRQSCDAIISINDKLALGIIEELQKRGISVPDDIAVSGSMNDPEGLFSLPALTTIDEASFELGRVALLSIHDQISKKTSPTKILVPTSLLIRGTCGCDYLTKKDSYNYDGFKQEELMFNQLLIQCGEILKNNRCYYNDRELQLFLESYRDALFNHEFSTFLKKVQTQLEKVLKTEDLTGWLAIISELEVNLLSYQKGHTEAETLTELLRQIIIIKSQFITKSVRFQSMETDYYINSFRHIVHDLNTSFDLNTVKSYIMDILDLTDLYISVYNEKTDNELSATNVLSVKEKQLIPIEKNSNIFKACELIPQNGNSYDQRFTLMVLPLSFRKNPLGFMVMNLSMRKSTAFENMQAIISTAIKNEMQIQDLKRNEGKLRSYINNAPDGVFVTDENGHYIEANTASENITGYSKAELVSMSVSDLYSPGELEAGLKHFSKVKETGKASGELAFTHKDGSKHWWFISAVKLSETRFLSFTNDITEKVKLEKHLNQKSKMESIGTLAGGMAHDFNNVLSGILSASELLRLPQNGLDAKSLKYVDMITQASVRASELIKKMLAFSRKGKVVTTVFDIHQILDDTFEILNSTIDKKITISIIKEASNHNILGDFSALESAFINLGINSSHAMPHGGTIQIKTKNIFLNQEYCDSISFDIVSGDFIHIEVKDTGFGIPEENLLKIFEPFFTTKGQGEGTGLGLSAVYGTILDHRGVIDVYSELGIGTTFNILLPCSRQIIKKVKGISRVLPGAGTILLVDDEKMNRILNKDLLESLGYKVLLAEDGFESLEIFREHFSEIDIVLMDMVMPKMNGSEAFYKMKNINENCKVIITSGYTQDKNIDALIKNGLAGFIKKPYTISEISTLIDRVQNKIEDSIHLV